MTTQTFRDWCKQFPGIVPALKNVSNDRNIWDGGAKIVYIIKNVMDFDFLMTSPIDEMYNEYTSPRIYAVLKNDRFCNVLGEEAYANHQQVSVVPFALLFLNMGVCNNVEYVIHIMRSGGSRIDNLKITIIYQTKDFNLKFAVQEITAAFENGGWRGVNDLHSRFETGVGLGRANRGDRAEVLGHQEVRLRAIQAGTVFKQRFQTDVIG
jgi:hypothetical protein